MPLDTNRQGRAPGELQSELNEQVSTYRSGREQGS